MNGQVETTVSPYQITDSLSRSTENKLLNSSQRIAAKTNSALRSGQNAMVTGGEFPEMVRTKSNSHQKTILSNDNAARLFKSTEVLPVDPNNQTSKIPHIPMAQGNRIGSKAVSSANNQSNQIVGNNRIANQSSNLLAQSFKNNGDSGKRTTGSRNLKNGLLSDQLNATATYGT